ncbi:MAG: hypothetical protein ABI591_07095 [Kofleriaceae bacterium]
MTIPWWALALLVIPALAGFGGLVATAMGLNKPPERRKKFFLTGAALTIVAAAMFLVILGILA